MTLSEKSVIGEVLYESANSVIYHSDAGDYETPVIVKILRSEYPTPRQIVRFGNEYEFTRDLDIEGIRRAHRLLKIGTRHAMVLEYVDGKPVREVFAGDQRDLGNILKAGTGIAGTLAEIHQYRIIHKDINGSNILVNPKQDDVRIIDFGISSRIDLRTEHMGNPETLEGTLAYISPEQTGRMNRVVDYRTDLYSLGVTLYELLTGKLPFEGKDAMEIVHGHIAKVPRPVCEVSPEIPPVVSDIVAKLMEKSAEDRYQSGYGLKADLERCLKQLEQTGRIEDFALAEKDFSGRFQIPQKLYGREDEIAGLMQAFERISEGGSELLLVPGYSGVGKTALVSEVHKPITAKQGVFISGKFDQFQRTIPYFAFVQAFRDFCRLVLTEPEETLEQWKTDILDAAGPLGKVLTDVIPDLELIIGKQPDVPELGPAEAQNRFNFVFRNFVKTIAGKDRPLAIFLDDLQWADAASLNLAKMLMTDTDIRHFLFIGAYRDNEVDPSHPLMQTAEEIRSENAVVSTVTVRNLANENVSHLISDALLCERSAVQPLADLVYEKTQGNAFFTIEFLKSLYEEELLVFDFGDLKWNWDVVKIREKEITGNVVELMADKIRELRSETQETLKLASCIGNTFDLRTLAVICRSHQNAALANLWQAVEEGLVHPLDENYKLIRLTDTESIPEKTAALGFSHDMVREAAYSLKEIQKRHETEARFKFQHDRIQQAAYSLIEEADKQAVHLRIGRLMLADTAEEDLEGQIFDIAGQLNKALERITDETERLRLAELNLRAGKKARASAAYEPAVRHLRAGTKLLPEKSWDSQYDLCFNLYKLSVECEYLSGNLKEAEQLFDMTLNNVSDPCDRGEVISVRCAMLLHMGHIAEGYDAGIQALKGLGIEIPSPDNQEAVDRAFDAEYRKFIAYARNTNISDWADLPDMTDRQSLIAMEILAQMIAITYFLFPGSLGMVVITMTNLSYEKGVSPRSASGLSSLTFPLLPLTNDYAMVSDLGQSALAMTERFTDYQSHCVEVNGGHISFWKRDLRESLDLLKQAFQLALEGGDIPMTTYAATIRNKYLFYRGAYLEQVIKEARETLAYLTKVKSDFIFAIHSLFDFMYVRLAEISADRYCLAENSEKEEKLLADFKADPALGMPLFNYYMNKTTLYYLFGEHEEAVRHAGEAEKYQANLPSTMDITQLPFYYALAIFAGYDNLSDHEKRSYAEKAEEFTAQLKVWSENCPANFLHTYLLVKAEKARLENRDTEAMHLYNQAIDAAQDHEFVQYEALADELAAKFYFSLGLERVALDYMREARYAYQRWGAVAKVKDLEEKYPEIMVWQAAAPLRPDTTATSETGTCITTTAILDTATIIKASQTMSREVHPDRLLDKMIRILIENAGATTGILIENEDDRLLIQAKGAAGEDRAETMQALPAEESGDIPQSVVRHAARTRTPVVLNDASRDEAYADDAYITDRQPKSLMCMPIVHQGKLTGLMYFENSLTTGAFTRDRLEVLNLLSSQVAISLENANLYATLEDKVRERTRQLKEAMDELWGEMELAKKIQTVLLPEQPHIPGYDIAVSMEPADEVGGDYYDVISVARHDWIVIGDVSGHGVPAGLVMMMAQTAIHTVLTGNPDVAPSRLLAVINRTIYENIKKMGEAKHMTIVVLAGGKDGNFSFAGLHEDILIRRAATGEVEAVGTDGMWIGITDDISEMLSDDTLRLEPGDCMVLFTDGITEAWDKENNLFGDERLVRIIGESGDSPASQVHKNIIAALESWRKPDDVTLIVVKRLE
ncbi:AAA family ATPase [Desulfobacterales bacterium HSG2]|nr:AAA family ATPase [Desulfobacterales bacterium HSG2]